MITRRRFGAASLGAAGLAAGARLLAAGESTAAAPDPARARYAAFVKYLTDLGYDELAESIAALGFGGVEVTVRERDGYLRPGQAAEELPKLRRALDRRGLAIAIVTTDILRADQPHAETVLQAAADAGAERYRLGFLHYDSQRPIVAQIEAIRGDFEKLAELNRRLGIAGMYQNHAGAGYFGATLWDLYYVLRQLDPQHLGCVYDLRHATVEAGQSWPTLHEVLKPHIKAYSVKDFAWRDRETQNVPLGEGRVDSQFYADLAKSDFRGPISLHVEYLEGRDPPEQLAALRRDLATLRQWMAR